MDSHNADFDSQVRLRSGALAVFSPVALTPEVKETVSALGHVKYIAALDMEHHIFLGPWHEAFPSAKVLGPEGLPEKRAKQGNEKIPFEHVFTAKGKDSLKVDDEVMTFRRWMVPSLSS